MGAPAAGSPSPNYDELNEQTFARLPNDPKYHGVWFLICNGKVVFASKDKGEVRVILLLF